METRGCVAEMVVGNSGEREMVFHATTQTSHALRWLLAMSTERASAFDCCDRLPAKRDKLGRFAAGAKAFANEKKDELAKSDNAGMLYQLHREPSTLRHMARTFLNVLDKDPSDIPSVVADDIGGTFGVKGHPSEDVAVAAMARRLDRSIKWIEDRNTPHGRGPGPRGGSDGSGRGHQRGRLLGMDVSMVMNQGAYPAIPFGAPFFSRIMKVMFPGTYRWDACTASAPGSWRRTRRTTWPIEGRGPTRPGSGSACSTWSLAPSGSPGLRSGGAT
ncbi:MAG: molybdopterin cofactor-binding domain-containing protein [Acidimicrobiales bacterium]